MPGGRIPLLLLVLLVLLACTGTWLFPAFNCQPREEKDLLSFYEYDKSKPLNPRLAPIKQTGNYTLYKLYFSSVKGEVIPALFATPRNVKGPYPCVLLVHGLGGSKEIYLDVIDLLSKNGFASLAIDLPSHGERGRRRMEPGEVLLVVAQAVFDLRRALDYLESRGDIDGVGVMGKSLGGIISSILAGVDDRVKALVIVSSGGNWTLITSGLREGEKKLALKALKKLGRYVEPLNYISRYKGPAQFHHGLRDTVIPPEACMQLYEAAGGPKEIYWYDAGHGVKFNEVMDKVLPFLKKNLVKQQPLTPSNREGKLTTLLTVIAVCTCVIAVLAVYLLRRKRSVNPPSPPPPSF